VESPRNLALLNKVEAEIAKVRAGN
jgi:hypothetical protein